MAWIGPAIGAGIGLLGSTGSRQAGTTTTSTSRDLPEWLKPYVTGNLAGAQTTRDQLTGTSNGLMNLAVPGYAATLRGDYLDPSSNPWLKSTFTQAADLTNARINSIFEGANRYGSGQQAGAIGTADSMLASNIFGGNYQAERARQNAAIGGVPQFNQGASTAAFSPYINFNSLIPNVSVGSESSPYFNNPLGGALGGAGIGYLLSRGGSNPNNPSSDFNPYYTGYGIQGDYQYG